MHQDAAVALHLLVLEVVHSSVINSCSMLHFFGYFFNYIKLLLFECIESLHCVCAIQTRELT